MSDIEAPVDPKGTMTYRAARLAVIVLSALIILALLGLVVGGIMKFSGRTARAAGDPNGTAFRLPPGAQILTVASEPGRVILHVRSSKGDEVDIVSTEDGRLIAQIKSKP